MNLSNIGWSGLLLIVLILLVFWGPSKLPEIGRAFGKSLREFKDATRGMMDEVNQPSKPTPEDRGAADTVQKSSAIEPIELNEVKDSEKQ